LHLVHPAHTSQKLHGQTSYFYKPKQSRQCQGQANGWILSEPRPQILALRPRPTITGPNFIKFLCMLIVMMALSDIVIHFVGIVLCCFHIVGPQHMYFSAARPCITTALIVCSAVKKRSQQLQIRACAVSVPCYQQSIKFQLTVLATHAKHCRQQPTILYSDSE